MAGALKENEMKCIRKTSGQVVRVKDEIAEKEVSEGRAKFVKKTVWKKEVRDK